MTEWLLIGVLILLLVLQDVRRGFEQERLRADLAKLIEAERASSREMMDRLQARSLMELQAVRNPHPLPPLPAKQEHIDPDWWEPSFARPPVGLRGDAESED